MATDAEKPAPLMVGDKPYYTLTSYEPIEVEVMVMAVTEEHVDLALETFREQAGAQESDLDDPQWLAHYMPGVSSRDELRSYIRAEIKDMAAAAAEEHKVNLVIAELTKRLRQAVPAQVVSQVREGLLMSFAQHLAEDGLTPETFTAQTGTTIEEVFTTLDQQAHQIAEQEAALDAFARERKMSVSEREFPELLGIPEDEFPELLKGVRAAGSYSEMRDAALHAKAAATAVSECKCTYRHESPEETSARMAWVRMMYAERGAAGGSKEPEQGESSGTPGFRLV